MKKTYMAPATETIRLTAEGMLATSTNMNVTVGSENAIEDAGSAWSSKKIWGESSTEKGLWEE